MGQEEKAKLLGGTVIPYSLCFYSGEKIFMLHLSKEEYGKNTTRFTMPCHFSLCWIGGFLRGELGRRNWACPGL